jgi:hypothetical protein
MRGADQKIFPELFLVALKREHYEQRLFTNFSPLLIMAQTQPNLTELAKQGNAKALAKRGAIAHIAALINRQLQPKSITAKAAPTHKDSCLRVILEAAHFSDPNPSIAY